MTNFIYNFLLNSKNKKLLKNFKKKLKLIKPYRKPTQVDKFNKLKQFKKLC